MPGPSPKDPAERVRRNLPNEPVTLKWDGKTRGPELPLNLPGIKWSTRTFQWWDTWRNSPQAMLMVATDWEVLLETALLVNQYWTPKRENVTGANGKITKRATPRSPVELKALAVEIRQRVAQFGATVADRKNLMEIVNEDDHLGELQIQQELKKVNYRDMLK